MVDKNKENINEKNKGLVKKILSLAVDVVLGVVGLIVSGIGAIVSTIVGHESKDD